MIKKGNVYCDYCHKLIRSKDIVSVKRSCAKMITQNKGKKQLTFCNWTCAYHGEREKVSNKKRRLDHLTIPEKEELLSRLGYKYTQSVTYFLNRSNVNGKKFTEIVLCDDPSKRRDEFYKLFKFENDADILWIHLMNWFFDYTEEELDAQKWETIERVHRILGIYDKQTLL